MTLDHLLLEILSCYSQHYSAGSSSLGSVLAAPLLLTVFQDIILDALFAVLHPSWLSGVQTGILFEVVQRKFKSELVGSI